MIRIAKTVYLIITGIAAAIVVAVIFFWGMRKEV